MAKLFGGLNSEEKQNNIRTGQDWRPGDFWVECRTKKQHPHGPGLGAGRLLGEVRNNKSTIRTGQDWRPGYFWAE